MHAPVSMLGAVGGAKATVVLSLLVGLALMTALGATRSRPKPPAQG